MYICALYCSSLVTSNIFHDMNNDPINFVLDIPLGGGRHAFALRGRCRNPHMSSPRTLIPTHRDRAGRPSGRRYRARIWFRSRRRRLRGRDPTFSKLHTWLWLVSGNLSSPSRFSRRKAYVLVSDAHSAAIQRRDRSLTESDTSYS